MADSKQYRMKFYQTSTILLVLVVGAVAFLSGNSAPTAPETTTSPITAADHVRGAATSTVSLIEYGDFECPACGAYEPLMEQLLKDYGTKVTFVFRNFPLTMLHKNAMLGAEAAEAAGLQGKYWEMHDLLYTQQQEWSTGSTADATKAINGYATSLGLNLTKFDADMQSQGVSDKIQSDMKAGTAAQIDHTPTFFINLKQIPNPQSYAQFRTALDDALAASR